MQAATRHAKSRTKRRKPAVADPWQAIPGLADLFDSQTSQPLTETKLLEQTAALLGVSLAGVLVYAKR